MQTQPEEEEGKANENARNTFLQLEILNLQPEEITRSTDKKYMYKNKNKKKVYPNKKINKKIKIRKRFHSIQRKHPPDKN